MRRGRSGSMAIELAMWLPVMFLLIGGIVQFGKITYIYYSLQKTMTAVANYLAVQNGVNFCLGASDPAIAAAIQFGITGTTDGSGAADDYRPERRHDYGHHAMHRPGDADVGRLRGGRLRHAGGRPASGLHHRFDAQRLHRAAAHSVHSGGPDSAEAAGRDGQWRRIMRRPRSGQASIEFALLYGAVILPLTFMVVFVSEMLWVWHSVVDFTRDGATYAATHCWMGDGGNVTTYMTTHVPRMIDMDKFQSGEAGLQVSYFSQDPATGQLTPFACASGAECSAGCVPDAVTVSVTSYQFTRGFPHFSNCRRSRFRPSPPACRCRAPAATKRGTVCHEKGFLCLIQRYWSLPATNISARWCATT